MGGPIFLALYPYFRCVLSLFFSEGKVDDRVSCGLRVGGSCADARVKGAAERATGDGCGSRTRFLSFIIFSNFRGRGET